jgi:hypothetical protein
MTVVREGWSAAVVLVIRVDGWTGGRVDGWTGGRVDGDGLTA